MGWILPGNNRKGRFQTSSLLDKFNFLGGEKKDEFGHLPYHYDLDPTIIK